MDFMKDKVQAIATEENGNVHQHDQEMGLEVPQDSEIVQGAIEPEPLTSTQQQEWQEDETEDIGKKRETLRQIESLYVSNKMIFMAGAVGGVGSVCIKLIGADELNNEVIQVSETQEEIDWLPGELSQVSLGLGVEFLLYLASSIFLGALSSFILIAMGGISTRIENRQRCLASAILFGLFFPSSIQLMKQNMDSQIIIESQQKEVEELKVKEEDLEEKNTALIEESKEAIVTLTQTEDIQEKPELKQKVLDGYMDVFRNVDEVNEQQELLSNIADVGRSNTTENTPITKDAVDFLELITTDKKYEVSVQEKAEEELSGILMKCDVEQIDCS